jgi:hypothetical protein
MQLLLLLLHLRMTFDTALSLHFLYSVLQVMLLIIFHVHCRDKDRSICEEVIHLLQRSLRGLWLDCPEEQSVGEVTHDLRDCQPSYDTPTNAR